MRIEIRTDRLAVVPWSRIGVSRTERLAELLAPIAGRVMDAGAVPVPNPMGLPWPPTPLSG